MGKKNHSNETLDKSKRAKKKKGMNKVVAPANGRGHQKTKDANQVNGRHQNKKNANQIPGRHQNRNVNSMSDLQLKMKRRLEAGKFRMINEQLYTSTGNDAFQLFQNEPNLFEVYHTGFREQVEKWPVNPIDIIIDSIKKNPNAIVADFGCGDAKLAKSLKNKVYSFDLVSQNDLVIACDMAHVPLEDSSIDIAVYCLALMGTSLMQSLLEGFRVLKPKGLLKIAEVKSRFECPGLGGIEGFIDRLQQIGFALKKKDEKNKMFVMLEFVKTKSLATAVPISLKACEYKRR